LNGLEDLQHLGAPVRCRHNPERPDDHVYRRSALFVPDRV
jgi:hypothetical protein